MSTETKSTEAVDGFPPRAVKLSAAIRRAQALCPRHIDLERFEGDAAYRLAAMIYGKDMVKLVKIPGKVLAEIILRALDQVRFRCEQAHAPKRSLDEVLQLGGSSKLIVLPEGASREKMEVYTSIYPREFNPVVPPPVVPGLEDYVDAMVVIADTGFYMWLPKDNRLVNITDELLASVFEKDPFVGWYMLWGIKEFVESLVREANRQLSLVTPLQTEINNIIARIAVR